jgi:hypothetical protein
MTLDSYFLDLEAVFVRQGIDRFVMLGFVHLRALRCTLRRVTSRACLPVDLDEQRHWLAERIASIDMGPAAPSIWDVLPPESWEAFLYTLVPNSAGEEAANLMPL